MIILLIFILSFILISLLRSFILISLLLGSHFFYSFFSFFYITFTLLYIVCAFTLLLSYILFFYLCIYPTIVRIFLRMFLKKYKLHNLKKKRNSYIDNNNNKKNMQIHKVYNCLLRVFIFWNRCMIVSLSMLQATSLSIYTTKQSSIHWSSIRLRSLFFIYFIAEKLLSTAAIATGWVKTNFTSK